MDSRLLENLRGAADGRADFIIVLREQADLSGAAKLATKIEKGRYVFEQLTEMAARTQAPLLQFLKSSGAPHRSFWVANQIAARGDLALIRSLTNRPEVARVLADPVVHAALPVPDLKNDAHPAPQTVEWNITKVRAPEVWALGYTGQGVVVGAQDTGYQWDHPALLRQYRGWDGTNANHNYNWRDAIHSGGGGSCGVDSLVPCDDHGHGTHTLGTVLGDDQAGNQTGMAPGARWIGCRNMNEGDGTPTTYTECFQWFLAPTDLNDQNPDPARAPDVINNSWSCPLWEGCTDPNVLRTVVENVRAAGIMVVVSAGNEGSGCSSTAEPPALYAASFSVGATDSSDLIAGFSSRGPVTRDGSNRLKPDISAPGVSIRSTMRGDTYSSISGTSMAAPHVAGLVALILSAHPGLKGHVDRIETLIQGTAVPLTSEQSCGGVPGTQVPNNTYGWGRIDAVAALGLGDADHDTMPDWWEIVFGLNPTNALDAATDADGDGFANVAEFGANTNPRDGASRLSITGLEASSNAVITVTWHSVQDGSEAARRYDVFRASALGGTNQWTRIATNLPADGVTTRFEDPLGTNTAGPYFYRVGISGSSPAVYSAQSASVFAAGNEGVAPFTLHHKQ